MVTKSHLSQPVAADTDKDGLPDGWELANNTDPRSMTVQRTRTRTDWTILGEFNARTDLNNPDTDADRLHDGDEMNVYATNPTRADTDLDHLNDGDEVLDHATDPASSTDLDKDGMADDWESVRGTATGIDDARGDADNDGVDNIIEYCVTHCRWMQPRNRY